MAVSFLLVSAAWPQEPSCSSCALIEESEDISCQPLEILNPECLDFTDQGLQHLRQKYEQKENLEHDLRMVIEAMSCTQIQHVSFIPKDPQIPSILYVKRSRKNEDLSQNFIYAHHQGAYRFILGVERASRVFALTKVALKTTLTDLDVDNIDRVERVLNFFQKDHKTTGIALTVLDRSNLSQTYLWFK